MNLDELREDFTQNAFFMNAWRDSTQHVGIYKDVVKNDETFKKEFREDLKNYLLKKVICEYQKKQISFGKHFELIQDFFDYVKEKYKEQVQFSFGCSQKLVNVFLKYYWCAGKLNGNEPAHMPLDRNILSIIKKTDITWTKMKNVDEYRDCITEAKRYAEEKNLSLAQWELKKFYEIMNQ